MSLRCVIVDDNAGFRNEMAALLEDQGISVAATVASGEQAHEEVSRSRPDVVLIDIDLREESGLTVARSLHEAIGSACPIILISTHDEGEYSDLIAESPAVGFIAKTRLSAAAIRALLSETDAV